MNSEILAAIICSYIIIGVSNTVSAVAASPLRRPSWVRNPTIGHALFSVFFWPFLTYMDLYFKSNKALRGIGYSIISAILNTLIQIFVPILLFWIAIKLTGLITSIFLVKIVLSIIVFYLSTFILSPIAFLIGAILFFPIYFILDIIFPLRNEK
jgi:hypothetical protein